MIRLQRYLLKELLAAFLLVLLLLTSVLFAGMMLKFLTRFSEVGLLAVLKAAPALLPLSLPITVPLAFLVAVLLTYGRFTEENEFLAFQMGGVHPWHAVAPTLVVGAVLSIVTLQLSASVIPLATLARKTIGRDQLQQLERAMADPARTDIELGDGFQMSWRGREGPWLRNVLITWEVETRSPRGSGVASGFGVWAERCQVVLDDASEEVIIHLRGAEYSHHEAAGGVSRFRDDALPLAFRYEDLFGVPPVMKNKGTDEMRASELVYRMRHGSIDVNLERKWAAEYWKRIAMGLTPLAFALLAAPLGLTTGHGSRVVSFVIAITIALPVQYPLLEWGETLARRGVLPAPLALGMSNLLFAGAGLWLLWRVSRA